MPESRRLTFPSVWLSTPAHLQAWERLYYDHRGRPRRFSVSNVPAGFPYVRPFWGLSAQALPIVYLASGILSIDDAGLRLEPKEYRFMGNRHVGLRQELAFTLRWDEIRGRERQTLVSPVAKMFNMTFAQLTTTRPGLLAEISLAVGFTGFSIGRAKQNDALLAALVPAVP